MEEDKQEGRTNIPLFQSFLMNGLLIIHEEITKENQSRVGGVIRDNNANFRFDFLKFDNVKHACLQRSHNLRKFPQIYAVSTGVV